MIQKRLILVVEDDPLIAMCSREALVAAGYEAAVAQTVPLALGLLHDDLFDGAVLDVSLRRNEPVFPVADRLAELSVPFLFASGAGVSIPGGVPVLFKPYGAAELVQAVAALFVQGPPPQA